MDAWWPRLSPAGGYLGVHSTLTNSLSRAWLERVRGAARAGPGGGGGGPFAGAETVSLLEPHKLWQNSITLLQKRGDGASGEYAEPVFSRFP